MAAILAATFLSPTSWAEGTLPLCGPIFLEQELSPALNSLEKRLICGEKEGAWAEIPLSQAEFTLRSYLKDRGYYYPTFQSLQGKIHVSFGPMTRVLHVKTENLPEDFDVTKRGRLLGEPLTPKLLRDLDRWAMNSLQNTGYPCPFIRSEADPKDGIVLVKGDAGKKHQWIGYTLEGARVEESAPLARYRAFSEHYDSRLIEITETRLVRENVFQSIRLRPQCGAEGMLLEQEAVVGSPRTFRIGAGISTESIFLAKASWQNSRIGPLYSSITLSALATGKTQNVNAVFDSYFLPESPRVSLQPSLEFRHSNEKNYEDLSLTARLGARTHWDAAQSWNSFWIGPTLDIYQTVRGTGPLHAQFFQLLTKFTQKSHDFEYNAKNPRSGYQLDVSASGGLQGPLSTAAIGRLVLDGKWLTDFEGQDPPPIVLGTRFMAGTVWSDLAPADLSPHTLFFMGGSTDLRGFWRKELPGSGTGAATAFYFGTELRIPAAAFETNVSNLIPLKIEPFIFIDFGILGSRSLSLDSPLYWSPGIGTRWVTPIGLLRMTLARGFPDSAPGHFQFFLSLGEEF